MSSRLFVLFFFVNNVYIFFLLIQFLFTYQKKKDQEITPLVNSPPSLTTLKKYYLSHFTNVRFLNLMGMFFGPLFSFLIVDGSIFRSFFLQVDFGNLSAYLVVKTKLFFP